MGWWPAIRSRSRSRHSNRSGIPPTRCWSRHRRRGRSRPRARRRPAFRAAAVEQGNSASIDGMTVRIEYGRVRGGFSAATIQNRRSARIGELAVGVKYGGMACCLGAPAIQNRGRARIHQFPVGVVSRNVAGCLRAPTVRRRAAPPSTTCCSHRTRLHGLTSLRRRHRTKEPRRISMATGCGYSAPYQTLGPSLSSQGVQVGIAGVLLREPKCVHDSQGA